MFRKNTNFSADFRSFAMVLVLNQQTHRERIVIGPKREVLSHMEGRPTQEQLYDQERPLGQLIFDWEEENPQDWNEIVIYELYKALQFHGSRQNSEQTALDFLKQKTESHNAVSVFWARNCLNLYNHCKAIGSSPDSAHFFESKMTELTRLTKNNILPIPKNYDVENVIERAQEVMQAAAYRQDASVRIFYSWHKCNEELVMIEGSILAGILFYLNRLLAWRTSFRVCDICGKHFIATSGHHNLCSEVCRSEKRRLNKQEFDQRLRLTTYGQDYYRSTQYMRKLIKRETSSVPNEVQARAQSFYKQILDEAKTRKNQIQTPQDAVNFQNWLFKQERLLQNILEG